MNILICSQYGELQVEEVIQKLTRYGHNCVLFERYRKDQFITYEYKQNCIAALRISDHEYILDSKTFPVVWYRPKPILTSEIPGGNANVEEKFCTQEWRAILRSLDASLQESKWVNPIWDSIKAASKPYQLRLAAEVGLVIPQTVITNDASKVLQLFKDSRVIYKTLSSFFTVDHAIYTNEIDFSDVISHREQISMAPGIFQKCIEKKYELRITIVGEKLFIVRINSQDFPEAKIDWRRCFDSSLYASGQISDQTRTKLLSLHKRLGLVYAAYDFAVDVEGNEVFIECNPSGQWLWLENFLQESVSETMVKELAVLH